MPFAFISFSLTPMMASRWLRAVPAGGHPRKSWLERLVDVFYRPIERVYMMLLRFCMSGAGGVSGCPNR